MKPRCCMPPAASAPPAPSHRSRAALASLVGVLLVATAGLAHAEERAAGPPRIDWGGGYVKGGDSRSTTVATSGAAQRPAAAKPAPAPAAPPPRVDWGGGYFKGGDSASNTPATSGGVDRSSKR